MSSNSFFHLEEFISIFISEILIVINVYTKQNFRQVHISELKLNLFVDKIKINHVF